MYSGSEYRRCCWDAYFASAATLRSMWRLLERDVRLVGEVEVVPGDLVAEDRRPLEGAQPLRGDHLVVLVDVVEAGLEDDVGPPLLPELDQQLEDLLAVLRERADVEVVDGEALWGMPSSAVASRTSRASVSGGKPSGSERVAIEKAT